MIIRNRAEELLQIYQDKGVIGFQQLKQHDLRLGQTVPSHTNFVREQRFSLIESNDGILNFIVIHYENGVRFIQCIYV